MTQQLLSTVDGFKIVIGSWIINLAALLAMLIAIRAPPAYDDPYLDKEATWTYCLLILMHAIMSFVKVWSLYIGTYFWDKQTILMLFVVGIQILICRNWLYNEDRDSLLTVPLTDQQKKFETWIYLEYILIYSNVAGAIMYIFINRVWKLQICA